MGSTWPLSTTRARPCPPRTIYVYMRTPPPPRTTSHPPTLAHLYVLCHRPPTGSLVDALHSAVSVHHMFFFYFKESLIAFIPYRIWRWTAAPGVPGGLSLPHGSVPALPSIYKCLHDELGYRLTPLLILPQHLKRSSLAISHPHASHQVRCILRCPTIINTPPLLRLSNLPEPLPLRPLVCDHIDQTPHRPW